jgi:hypothetical protein
MHKKNPTHQNNIDEDIDLLKWGVKVKYERMDTYLN